MSYTWTGAGATNDSGIPAYIVWILISSVGAIMLVAAVVVTSVLCIRRRRPDKRTESEQQNDELVTCCHWLNFTTHTTHACSIPGNDTAWFFPRSVFGG